MMVTLSNTRLQFRMDTGHVESIRRSPLVEELDDGRMRVTVSYHDPDADELWVIGGLAGADPGDRRLRRAGDGWWERTYELPRDVRTAYWITRERFAGNADLRHDPLNARTHVYRGHPEDADDADVLASVLELPDAPAFAWSLERDVPRGSVEMHRLASERLGNTRRVYTYTPPAYDAAQTYPLVVCFDGWAYVDDAYVPLPRVFDNLIAAGRIPSVVAVLPDSIDNETRMRELVLHEGFVEFLVEEMLSWARERLSFQDDPERTLVTGSSAGGLAAAFAALRRPDRFGLVLSQSGAFGRAVLAHEFATHERLGLRFYLDVGILEAVPWWDFAPLVHANRHLRDVLLAKGYDVTYREFPGGHDYFWWRETIADGLIALLGRS
jgi:enterochelin esterase family protein